jgi:hypothetical protein
MKDGDFSEPNFLESSVASLMATFGGISGL